VAEEARGRERSVSGVSGEWVLGFGCECERGENIC